MDDAIRSFEGAAGPSGYGTALYNLGIAWIWREDIPRALRCFAETAKAKCAHGCPVTDSAVFRSRVKHDAEQIGYLFERGLSARNGAGIMTRFSVVRASRAGPGTVSANRVASPCRPSAYRAFIQPALYIAPCDTIADGALAADLDHAAIEARYLATQPR